MRSPHILLITGNVQKLQRNLTHLLDSPTLALLRQEVNANIAGLYGLGLQHYTFARRQNNADWRQAISRYYYGAYSTSRALRLCVNGEYSADSSDHKKIELQPADFPQRDRFGAELAGLRDDRNLCDYDHTCELGDLVKSPLEWGSLVSDYLDYAKAYLAGKGISLP